MAKPSGPRLSRRKADLHEALHLRLIPLLRLAEGMALRRPGGLVDAQMRSLAEAALFDARGFRPRSRHECFPHAVLHYAPLAGQLGAALADLGAFQARHSHWDGGLGAQVWDVEGSLLPVRRLMPKLTNGPGRAAAATVAAVAAREAAALEEMRRKVELRIQQFRNR
ncbi:MAG: hypothetical protein P0Y65_18030 [Candidatus Devosia phytovorans]|uniref:Uncharacterized protein n=1 Tax=Candidatus Devosia phytovorans TaxID=3121372 RepID=A0AAJ5VSL2_9HYPH|nr:hypothetical protein [Devosia sp.]WEK04061.1 MAG: hypothetical protein P0Y65_18030 [Devosia sp.]